MDATEIPRILLVDDEAPILASIRRLLAFEPYQVEVVPDPKLALDVLRTHEVAVVMSDQHMPDCSGVEFLRYCRERNPDATRILFSGHIDVDLLRAAVNGGEVYRFLTKPWDDDELLTAIRHGVERWQLRLANRRLREETAAANQELRRVNRELADLVAERTAEMERRRTALVHSQAVLDALPAAVIGVEQGDQVVIHNHLALACFPDLRIGAPLPAEARPQGDGLVETPLGPVLVSWRPEATDSRRGVITAVPQALQADASWLEP